MARQFTSCKCNFPNLGFPGLLSQQKRDVEDKVIVFHEFGSYQSFLVEESSKIALPLLCSVLHGHNTCVELGRSPVVLVQDTVRELPLW